MRARRRLGRLLLALLGCVVALAAAELALRAFGPAGPRYGTYFLDADRKPTSLQDALAKGDAEASTLPRNRPRWTRALTYWVCYRHGHRTSMDAEGCVRVDINGLGLRDRAELTMEKPPGRKRVLCLGDSFTAGWGVAIENAWVRLIEPLLAERGEVETVNCGLAGTLLIDECWWGLRDRFGRFEPDVVLQTICLNDLVPIPSTLALFRDQTIRGCDAHGYLPAAACARCVDAVQGAWSWRGWLRWSRLARLAIDSWDYQTRTDLDPAQDWGRWLLELPASWPAPLSYYELQGMPVEASWREGAPQAALVAMRDWCRARRIPFGVVVWPLFQGLETGRVYPFETLHRVVREFCAASEIPVLDLLPAFRDRDSASFWVDPSDLHANEDAHALAAPRIAGFVKGIWR